MLTYLSVLIIGCLAGILGSLLGVSGGIIMLPANQFILGLSPLVSVGTSLFAAIFTTSSGAYGHFRKGNVRTKEALWIGSGGLAGIFLGSYVFKAYMTSNTSILELLLGLLFLGMAIRMGQEAYLDWHSKTPVRSSSPNKFSTLKFLLLGFFTGTMAGVLGVGGGFIIVPVLIFYFAASPFQAVGTALLAMLPYITIGALMKLQQGYVNLPIGLYLGLGTIIGAQIGVLISKKIKPLTFKLFFTLIFLYLAWRYL